VRGLGAAFAPSAGQGGPLGQWEARGKIKNRLFTKSAQSAAQPTI